MINTQGDTEGSGGMTGNPVQYGPEVAKAKRKRKEKKEERHQQTRDVCGSKCLKDNTTFFQYRFNAFGLGFYLRPVTVVKDVLGTS